MAQTAWQIWRRRNILIFLPSKKLNILSSMLKYPKRESFFAMPEWNKRLWFISKVYKEQRPFKILYFALVGLKSWWRPWLYYYEICWLTRYFKKITAVTWSIDEIIPVSMALENIEQSIWHAADLYSVRISCSVFTWPNI